MAHERRAALEDRPVADCVLAVCQIADELNAPILADLISLRERMWGRLLDHSRAERIQVTEEEYPAHMQTPVPPDEIGRDAAGARVAVCRARPGLPDGAGPARKPKRPAATC